MNKFDEFDWSVYVRGRMRILVALLIDQRNKFFSRCAEYSTTKTISHEKKPSVSMSAAVCFLTKQEIHTAASTSEEIMVFYIARNPHKANPL
jgi:signal recognition particle receptor subunit beta